MNMSEWLGLVRFETLTIFFKGITYLGNDEFLYLFLPVLYWCWRKRAGIYLIALITVAAYTSFIIKGLLAWERPSPDLWLVEADGYTFPSIHAVSTMVIWGYIACEEKKKWLSIVAISVIFLVALSRVYLGVHYPQDVLAGIALGAIFLFAFRWLISSFKTTLVKVPDIIKGAFIILVSLGMLFIQSNIMIATVAGMLAGVVVGFLFEPHFADFDVVGGCLVKILRILIGLIMLLAIRQGLEWVLPTSPAFRWFELFILGTWISAGTPWLFVQLKLASREM